MGRRRRRAASRGPGHLLRATHDQRRAAIHAPAGPSLVQDQGREGTMTHIRGVGRLGRRLAVWALTAAALAAVAPIARAAVSAGLTPASQTVTPGTDFDLFFDVTAAGASFNGFDVVVSYDPAALTFVPLSPSS